MHYEDLSFLEDLILYDYIEAGTTEYGIARQIQARGLRSLSPKQRAVYDNVISRLRDKMEDEDDDLDAGYERAVNNPHS